jgi:hypothetical protein
MEVQVIWGRDDTNASHEYSICMEMEMQIITEA